MQWFRMIGVGVLTGAAVAITLLIALAVGIPNFDEFLIVTPLVAIQLAVLYAAALAIIHAPVAACLRAAGRPGLIQFAGLVIWPALLLLLRLVGFVFHWNKRPTLKDDLLFLPQSPSTSIPLLAGLAVAGFVFMRTAGRNVRT